MQKAFQMFHQMVMLFDFPATKESGMNTLTKLSKREKGNSSWQFLVRGMESLELLLMLAQYYLSHAIFSVCILRLGIGIGIWLGLGDT